MNGTVRSVSSSGTHTFSKRNQPRVRLITGIGVEGDAHSGTTVKHRSRVAKDPAQPNLRQVHLLPVEILDELRSAGFDVSPGQIGENITTQGIELRRLPTGTRLYIGSAAIVEVTGLRNPCGQLDTFQRGLTAALLERDEVGALVRKAGIMGIVLADGEVYPGDTVRVELPTGVHEPLKCV